MITLKNGHEVLAECINFQYPINDKGRNGAGTVIAFDAIDPYSSKPLFVTWKVWRNEHNEMYVAEHGHYGKTWNEAVASMTDRFIEFAGLPGNRSF